MKMELRSTQTSLKSNGDLIVEGYVNKTDSLSELLGVTKKFKEKISKGAFKRALENRKQDIDFLSEHDNKKILASTRNGSLELREDEQGLFMSATITPTTWGKDTYELISSGLVTNMSFGFKVLKDSWEFTKDFAIRTVEQLELFEVSVVKEPAYSQSSIAARGIDIIEDVQIPEKNTVQKKSKEEKGEMTMEKKIEKRSMEYEALDKYLRNEAEIRNLQTTASGAAVIPLNVHNTIIKKMEETSPVFAKARKLPSVSGTLKIAKEYGGATNAGFVEEGEELTMDILSLTDVKLTQKRVGAAIQLSNQLQNDAAIDIVDYSVNLLSRRLAKVIEKSILTGEKDTEFLGIISEAIPTVEFTGTAADVEMENLQELYLSIHPDFLDGAGFIMQRNFFNAIAKKTDANGHFYLQNGIVNGKFQYTLFGLPVDITDALPETTPVVFGNIEEAYAVMIKKGMGVTHVASDTANALRGSRLIVLDAYMDGAVVNEQAVAKLVLA